MGYYWHMLVNITVQSDSTTVHDSTRVFLLLGGTVAVAFSSGPPGGNLVDVLPPAFSNLSIRSSLAALNIPKKSRILSEIRFFSKPTNLFSSIAFWVWPVLPQLPIHAKAWPLGMTFRGIPTCTVGRPEVQEITFFWNFSKNLNSCPGWFHLSISLLIVYRRLLCCD